MFFGAGNVIFPLIVGQMAGGEVGLALLGLILTAVLIPFIGLYSMSLYDGNWEVYFGRLGRIPSFIVVTILLSLLGPFGAIPRCITLSYATFTELIPQMPLMLFSLAVSLCIALLLLKQRRLLDILGAFLTPLLLLSLGWLILRGFTAPETHIQSSMLRSHAFTYGLREGYQTMDLLAAFFFSGLVCQRLKKEKGSALGASLVGALLLGSVYASFAIISAHQSALLEEVSSENLLGTLGRLLIGGKGGLLVTLIIGLSCFTTALALTEICSDFLRLHVFQGRISRFTAITLTLFSSSLVSILKFSGIVTLLAPMLKVCYPALLLFAILSIIFYRKPSIVR